MNLGNAKKNLEVFIEFLGTVAGILTGPATLVTIRRGNVTKRILIDFGCFQGEYEHLNSQLVIAPDEIDFVLLTHAHFEHCGGVPILYRSVNGCKPYNGNIYGSYETLEQAKHILWDFARTNKRKFESKVNELRGIQQSHGKNFSANAQELKMPEVLYLPEDVDEAVLHFLPIEMEKEISLCEGIDVKFIPSSHINGSTMIEIYATYGAERYGIAFSGDIGKRKTPLYKEMIYEKETRIDVLVLDSFHGAQEPLETYIDSIRIIKKILKKCIREQKNVYIPVPVLDKSAIFVMVMNLLMDSGLKFKCFFDSPLGEKELITYMRAYNSQTSYWFDYDKKYPFDLERIDFVSDFDGHVRLVKRDGPNVVLTSSCTGYAGPVMDYFERHIQDEDAVFIFPGYFADNCPSKILCEANNGDIVEINGRKYVKHCETYQLHGFSSSGYLEDKLEIIERYSAATTIYLNHGDDASLYELEQKLLSKVNAQIVVPNFSEVYSLT